MAFVSGDVLKADEAIRDGATIQYLFDMFFTYTIIPGNSEIINFLAERRKADGNNICIKYMADAVNRILWLDLPDIAIDLENKFLPCGVFQELQHDSRQYGYVSAFDSKRPPTAVLRYAENYLSQRSTLAEILPSALVEIVLDYEEDRRIPFSPHQNKYVKYANDARQQVKLQNFKTNVIYAINVIPAAINAFVDSTRAVMEPTIKNAAQAFLSTTHLYSLYVGVNYYGGAAFLINSIVHVTEWEYWEIPKDVLLTIGSMTLSRFIIYMGQPLYMWNPYVVPVYSTLMSLGVVYAAYNNVLSLNTKESALKSALAWKDVAHKITEWKLPIISDFASSIEKYAIQKANALTVSNTAEDYNRRVAK